MLSSYKTQSQPCLVSLPWLVHMTASRRTCDERCQTTSKALHQPRGENEIRRKVVDLVDAQKQQRVA